VAGFDRHLSVTIDHAAEAGRAARRQGLTSSVVVWSGHDGQ
jgi:hypothetical protein